MELRNRQAIGILACGAFASAAAVRICDPLLPLLAKTFDVSTSEAAKTITYANLGYGLALFFAGPLGDRFGKLRVIFLSCILCAGTAFAAALCDSLNWLIVVRGLMGAATAALIPLAMAWIGDSVSLDERQNTLAFFMLGQILGLVGGQSLGGMTADILGWNAVFLMLGAVYCVVAWAMYKIAQCPSQNHYSLVDKQVLGWSEVFFKVYRSSHARIVLGTVFVESLAVLGSFAFVPTYLHEKFAIPVFQAGALAATFGLGGLAYAAFSKAWLKRLKKHGLIYAAGNILGFSFLIVSISDNLTLTTLGCTLAGFGFYMHHVTLQAEATQILPEARGTGVSIFASVFFMGQAAGVAFAAFVIKEYELTTVFYMATIVLPLIAMRFRHYLLATSEAPTPS